MLSFNHLLMIRNTKYVSWNPIFCFWSHYPGCASVEVSTDDCGWCLRIVIYDGKLYSRLLMYLINNYNTWVWSCILSVWEEANPKVKFYQISHSASCQQTIQYINMYICHFQVARHWLQCWSSSISIACMCNFGLLIILEKEERKTQSKKMHPEISSYAIP